MHRILLIGLLAAGLSGISAAAQRSFAGKWELLVKKSDFGNLPKPERMTVEATVQGDVMHAVQNTYIEQGNRKAEFEWYLDGKRHSIDKPVPGYTITQWQGNTLVNEQESNDGAYKETIRVSISPDGQTATEEIQSKGPTGSNRAKLIWKKRP